MLEALSVLGGTLVATRVAQRSRAARRGTRRSAPNRIFEHVETVADPAAARERALELAGPDGAVLVTGSLYLLGGPQWPPLEPIAAGEKLSIFAFAIVVLVAHRRRSVRRGLPHRQDAAVIASTAELLQLGSWLVIRNLLLFFAVVFWLAFAYWIVQGRAAAHRGPVARRRWRRCSASCRSSARSSTCCSARRSTSRTCASASSRSRRWRSRLSKRDLALPGLPRRGRLELPRLPDLHDEAAAGVRDVPGAARGAVAGVPVLRDPDRADGRLDCRAASSTDVRRPIYSAARWPWSGRSS